MSQFTIERRDDIRAVCCGDVQLGISARNGCVCRSMLLPNGGNGVLWSEYEGDVVVDDGLLQQSFSSDGKLSFSLPQDFIAGLVEIQ